MVFSLSDGAALAGAGTVGPGAVETTFLRIQWWKLPAMRETTWICSRLVEVDLLVQSLPGSDNAPLVQTFNRMRMTDSKYGTGYGHGRRRRRDGFEPINRMESMTRNAPRGYVSCFQHEFRWAPQSGFEVHKTARGNNRSSNDARHHSAGDIRTLAAGLGPTL